MYLCLSRMSRTLLLRCGYYITDRSISYFVVVAGFGTIISKVCSLFVTSMLAFLGVVSTLLKRKLSIQSVTRACNDTVAKGFGIKYVINFFFCIRCICFETFLVKISDGTIYLVYVISLHTGCRYLVI